MDTQALRAYFLDLQARIVARAEALDGQPFLTDAWTREPGGRLEGDGVTRLIEQGGLFERGGCNFSHV
jgi:coproporphyrinogen III oxidase